MGVAEIAGSQSVSALAPARVNLLGEHTDYSSGLVMLMAIEHEPESHLIPLVLDVAIGKGRSISVFGDDYDTPDGTCIRDYIHVADLSDAHILALGALNREQRILANLGNGNGF